MSLTSEATLIRGTVGGTGDDGCYYALDVAPGEAHSVRRDFWPSIGGVDSGALVCTFAHITDLHLGDPQSPARLEFLTRLGRGYRFRPQEMLISHAAVSMAETLASLPLDFCVMTGDAADNAQENEIRAYLQAFDGGIVDIVAPEGEYMGVQSLEWGDDWYWRPEGGTDSYRRRWGYPSVPGLIENASRAIDSGGLGHPWIACAGNHDLLFAGDALPNDLLSRIATGTEKARALPPRFASEELTPELYHNLLLTDPSAFFDGATVPVRPSPLRRLVSRQDFIRLHSEAPSAVPGHGFSSDGLGYYSYDPAPGVRVLMIDTNHPFGAAEGSIDREQLAWLEVQLRAASGPDDPMIIIASHHASPSISNAWGVEPGNELETAFAAELLRVIQECPNVVLWLNGHHHHNRVIGHFGPRSRFFEVTTASITDWPTQARMLEIRRLSDGGITITSTMVDHSSPAHPDYRTLEQSSLAALHRELAANEHFRGNRPNLAGSRFDRNVVMVLPTNR